MNTLACIAGRSVKVASAAVLLSACGCAAPNRQDAVVDCSTLSRVPAEDVERFDSQALLADLAAGEIRLAMRWRTPTDTRAYVSNVSSGRVLPNLHGGWNVHTDLSCIPQAAAHVHLAGLPKGPQPLSAGIYDFSLFGFDVPYLEQGEDPNSMITEGFVVVEEVQDGRVTGYLDGRGEVALKSHYDQRYVGVTVELLALAFRDVRLVGDYD